jgi:aspartate kinase
MVRGTRGDKKQTVVLKIGGSIIANAESYSRAASFLRELVSTSPGERYVVVVSAQNGTTDKLETEARRITPAPDTRMLDLLWATGELRSVALLTLHLHALSLPATGLNVHETGLKSSNPALSPNDVTLVTNGLQSALADHAVVVVPGFLASSHAHSIVSLGRGGSDLTAVLLAVGLKAARCELVKDVPGYFTADPNVETAARHIPSLTYQQALAMADNGCDLVQRKAIEFASEASLPLVIRTLNDTAPRTVVSG